MFTQLKITVNCKTMAMNLALKSAISVYYRTYLSYKTFSKYMYQYFSMVLNHRDH